MIKKLPYQSLALMFALFLASFLYMPSKIYGQETGGKKLEVSEKNSPSKMDNKKIRTSKRRKAKGNPNKDNNKVIKINPFKWDWGKVMWFKAKKSDYETKDYNPDKRTKRKTYDNKPNYKSADREAITNPSKLKKPLIPYDSRIADEGPVLQKKQKPKNVNILNGGPQDTPKLINLNDPSETLSKAPKRDRGTKVEGKKLYSRRKDKDRKPFDNNKLETASAPDLDPKMDEGKIMFKRQKDDFSKMNNDKLMISDRPDYKSNKPDGDKLFTMDASNKKPKPFDNEKLMTERVNDGKRNKFDDKKLMISEPMSRERKAYDDSKLMTVEVKDKKRKPFDNDKLMTERVNNEKRNDFDDKKLMTSEPMSRDRKAFDDSKLMTIKVKDKERKPFNDDKLMTAQPANRERKPFDNSKLMTATPANPDRKKFDDSKLMTATISKPKKQELHDDRLLTVLERKKPTDEMKETSKDISKLDGDYKRHFYVSSESHPGTKILAAENTNAPFLARTFQSISSFFTSIWKDDTQPNYVTRKKPKERRNKKEGMIWDNSVHPDEWKKQKAESGEQQ